MWANDGWSSGAPSTPQPLPASPATSTPAANQGSIPGLGYSQVIAAGRAQQNAASQSTPSPYTPNTNQGSVPPVTPQAAPSNTGANPSQGSMPGLGYSQVVAAGRQQQPLAPFEMPKTNGSLPPTNTPKTPIPAAGYAAVVAAGQSMPKPSGNPAQDWINNPDSKFGGMDNYTAVQRARYQKALQDGDYDLINRLKADSQAKGFTLVDTGFNEVAPTEPTPVDPAPAQVDYLALARAEFADQLAARRTQANQAKSALQAEWTRSNQTISDNRALDRAWLERNTNPFGGQAGVAKDNMAREWSLADESSLNRFNQGMAAAESGYSDFANTVEDQIRARAGQLQSEAEAQALQRAALTGTIGTTRTLQGVQSDRAGDQQAWENRFNYGQATGTFANGQKTLDKVQQEWENNFKTGQFNWQKAQQTWENAFQGRKFEQDMKDAAASRGVQWASLSQRDKEFIADQEFREKQFTLEQDKFELSKSQNGSKLSDKESTDNYNTIYDDLQTTGLTKETARTLLQSNKAFLTDSDYSKLNSYINDSF